MGKSGRSYADINGPSKIKPEVRKRGRSPDAAFQAADWGVGDPAILQRVIAACARDGGAVRFGYTRDGGAYAIGIYGDGDPFTEYLSPREDLNEWLTGIALDYEK